MGYITNFPDGIMASPLIGGGSEYAGWYGTNAWFVDGDNGNDLNPGTSTEPFATIQAGINAAGSQDTVFIRTLAPDATDLSEPGTYEEDLTIAVAKHGLKLVGVGGTQNLQPFGGPKIKNATATALLTINASNVLIKGLQFNCTRNSGTYGIYTDGSDLAASGGSVGLQVIDCYFKNCSATYGGIYLEGGYCSLISRCTFHLGTNNLGVYIDSNATPSNGHTVEYCNFKSNNGAAVAKHLHIRGGAEDVTVHGCTFGEATVFILVAGTPSGLISGCYFTDASATLANSTGKVTIPATQTMKCTGCWGGVSLAVIQSAA